MGHVLAISDPFVEFFDGVKFAGSVAICGIVFHKQVVIHKDANVVTEVLIVKV
ncbi:hypothetical protein C0991_011994, partial [Blastosporella zonata]